MWSKFVGEKEKFIKNEDEFLFCVVDNDLSYIGTYGCGFFARKFIYSGAIDCDVCCATIDK